MGYRSKESSPITLCSHQTKLCESNRETRTRSEAQESKERAHKRETASSPTSSVAMSLLRGFSALRLSAPTTTTTCLCRALSSSARPSLLRPSPLLSLAARPSLSAAPTLPAQQSILGSVRTFKMPKGAKKSKKSPLARGSAKTARKHGKRAVSSAEEEAGGVQEEADDSYPTLLRSTGQAAVEAHGPDQLRPRFELGR